MTDTPMVERLASSIERQFDDEFVQLLDHEGPLSSYGLSHRIARAVLQELREPTSGMMSAAGTVNGYVDDNWSDISDHEEWWKAMIDAALDGK